MAKVFHASQNHLIRAVLNRLVPAGDGLPAAGELDLVDHLDRAACSTTGTRRMFVDGIRRIAVESERRHAKAFEDLAAGEQDAVLRHVERGHRVFFDALVSHVYQAYYSHPVVVRLLGLEVRPPQPHGHALPPFDAATTQAMSRRAALYRKI